MRRKLAALLLCLLLVFQMSAVPSEAAGTVYFTAVNKNVLSLSDATMPFWSGGYLYVPSTIFTGVGRDLGVSYYPNIAKQTVLLYVDDTIYSSLVFDLNKDYAIDNEGNMYFQKPIQRGGVIFLPISLIARCFGLLYSTVEVDRGYLVWVRNPDMDMEERYFADAARSRMDYEYSQYLRNQGAAAEETVPEQSEPSVVTGQRIYLSMEAAESAAVSSLLDTLDRYDAQAAFYCTAGFLEEAGDLLRRMSAAGQAIGLIADAADDRPVTEQLEAGNRLLSQAASVKTRLAWIRNATAEAVAEAEAAGFCCLTPDLDRSAYPLSSTGAADTLFQRVTSRSGAVTVWLGDGANAAGLGSFLSAAEAADDRCLAMTETVS
ncbi:polysaccharide deacetylase family protein [uncultured Oscillibacter sp.]|uniref:polysaccharide deacetylase family protein n=1 Tax=uncultured Oscillibacter sp. TaxID=876091 RepID=UPI001F8D38DE|nr:polysaccharide deacetylase family protein [uncultured Oscillibacter sp.]HJB76487.1 polysaccharide deacetylase family protein [Candidatus Oscillibacter avistercoris]